VLLRTSSSSAGRGSCQAIAKAEIVRGNAGRLGRSVHAVPGQDAGTGQDGLAALRLLVRARARGALVDATALWPKRSSSTTPDRTPVVGPPRVKLVGRHAGQ